MFLLLLVVVVGAERHSGPYRVYRVTPVNDDQVRVLNELWLHDVESKYDFWQPPRGVGAVVDVMSPPETDQQLVGLFREHNITHTTIIEDVHQLIQARTKKADVANRLFGPVLRDSASNAPTYNMRAYGSYMQMQKYMEGLERTYPNIAKVITLGTTHEGRSIQGIKIGNGAGADTRKAVWIDGGIHAREWAAPHTVMYIMDQLVTKYNKDPSITAYINNLNFYLLPVVNPDGYEYTRSSQQPAIRLWRKNRSPEECQLNRWGRSTCCQGVDLNRNFDFHWSESGASDNPCSEIYQGKAVFSEPESRAVRDKVLALKGYTEAFVTLHTYSQIWIHPFGDRKYNYPTDIRELEDVGKRGARAIHSLYGTEFKVGSGADTLYPASGGSDDWTKSIGGAKYVYLLELRPDEKQWDGFILDETELVPTALETWTGLRIVVDAVMTKNGFANGSSATSAAPSAVTSGPGDKQTKDTTDCYDRRYACKKWIETNPRICTSVRYFMQKECPASCQFCRPPVKNTSS